MSFPYHDAYWADTAKFLTSRVAAEHKVLAPDDFWRLFPRIYRYINTRLKPGMSYDWAVIHKGQLGELAPEFLHGLVGRMVPVLANPVFVVWSGAQGTSGLPISSTHVRPMIDALKAAGEDTLGAPTQNEHDPVLPDPGAIVQFESLSIPGLRAAMNGFWQNGGYRYDTQRDRVYMGEIDSFVSDFLGETSGRVILDLCSGAGRLSQSLHNARAIIGADLSDVAVRLGTEAYRDNSAFKFVVMDAHALGFASSTFDIVTFLEAIEHVHDVPRVISEVTRVLKPGGVFLVTTANTDSLHLIMTRKLGYPPFKTSFQHIKEFSFGEARNLIEQHGLKVVRSGGIFLYPYWGIPGVDQVMRSINDSDPEVVELMRQLGRRVGPENAYAFVLLAQKPK
jgi:SAM-dependent methyltransferase